MYDWFARYGFSDGIHQLLGREPPHHGDDTVVTANGMKSEGKREEPEPRRCDPASSEVADDHPHSRHAIHFPKKSQSIRPSEVMQHLRAHHDVDALIRKGQTQRMRADRIVQRAAARAHEHGRGVYANRPQLDPISARHLSRATRDVSESGSNVEQRCLPWQTPERVTQLLDGRVQPTEKRVGPGNIGE
jgi:hypothetical protein